MPYGLILQRFLLMVQIEKNPTVASEPSNHEHWVRECLPAHNAR